MKLICLKPLPVFSTTWAKSLLVIPRPEEGCKEAILLFKKVRLCSGSCRWGTSGLNQLVACLFIGQCVVHQLNHVLVLLIKAQQW